MVGWIVAGIAAWTVAATGTAVLFGRMCRLRDRQVPPPSDPRVVGIPAQRCAPSVEQASIEELRGR